jgi:glycosyltransferase involved in cell wall biosynthesis
MKVLFLRPRADLGGATRHMVSLADALAERDHQVILAAHGGEWLSQFTSWVTLPLYPSSPLTLIAAVAPLVRLVRREQIGVLHSHHRFTTVIGRFVSAVTGVPLVCTVHEFKINWGWLAQAWLAPQVCVVSRALQEHLVWFYHVPPDRVSVIRMGVPQVTLAPDTTRTLRTLLKESSSGPVIGYIGRLAEEKGVTTLLQALPAVFKRHPESCLVIIGDGNQRMALEAQTASLRIHEQVYFAGERRDASELMAAMAIIVVPSLTESFGLVAAEALAAARPVVASAVGGLPEVVEHGVTGLLVPPADPAALAQAIIQVLDDPERAKQMGETGQRKVAQWTPAHAAESIERVYLTALRRSSE